MDEKLNFPLFLLNYFSTEALKNYKDGHVETLAIVLGEKSNNLIEIQELVFPEQRGQQNSVQDAGNIIYKNILFNIKSITLLLF